MEEKLQILKDLVSQLSTNNSSNLRNRIKSAISDVESQYSREMDKILTSVKDLKEETKKCLYINR